MLRVENDNNANTNRAQYKTKAKKIVGIAQSINDPKLTMGMYFEAGEPPTPEEELALKEMTPQFWSEEEATSSYWEFKE